MKLRVYKFNKILKKAGVFTALAALLVSSSLTVQAKEQDTAGEEATTIHVAVQKSTYSPYLTKALGYFDDAFSTDGTKVELTEFSQGAPMVEAVNSGDINTSIVNGDIDAAVTKAGLQMRMYSIRIFRLETSIQVS